MKNTMKKALSLTLALALCAALMSGALIPMTAQAYGDQYIQLEKENFDPNERMTFGCSGFAALKEDRPLYIVFDRKDANGDWKEVSGKIRQIDKSDTTNWMIAPAESGDYQLRAFIDLPANNKQVVTTIPFTVGKVAKDGAISLDKGAYTALERITVSVSGITEQMVTAQAFVGIYEKGAEHGSTGWFCWVKAGDSTEYLSVPNKNGEFEMRLYNMANLYNDETFVMSVPFTVSGAVNTSGWAQDQQIAEKAAQYGLIPDSLKGADWTKPITRAEFAAVSVKLYENLADIKATPVAVNPFTDTKDAEILKAVNIGVTNGTSETKFGPNDLLNREQAATMLTRALKTAYIPGWTLKTDGDFTLSFTMPDKFADDAKISDWAKPSVYFMVTNKIINGMGDNMFGPKNVTEREVAMGYANATREQALAIAVRIVENLKGKPLGFQQGAATEQP